MSKRTKAQRSEDRTDFIQNTIGWILQIGLMYLVAIGRMPVVVGIPIAVATDSVTTRLMTGIAGNTRPIKAYGEQLGIGTKPYNALFQTSIATFIGMIVIWIVGSLKLIGPAQSAIGFIIMAVIADTHLQYAIHIVKRQVRAQASPGPKAQPRIHSKEPRHYAEDLEAAMNAAGLDVNTPAAQLLFAYLNKGCYTKQDLGTNLSEGAYPKQALREIKNLYGNTAYGAVLLFSIEAKTSLSGDSEVLTSPESLEADDTSIANLGWPNDVLRYSDEHLAVAQTPVQQARLEHLRNGVVAWRDKLDAELAKESVTREHTV